MTGEQPGRSAPLKRSLTSSVINSVAAEANTGPGLIFQKLYPVPESCLSSLIRHRASLKQFDYVSSYVKWCVLSVCLCSLCWSMQTNDGSYRHVTTVKV